MCIWSANELTQITALAIATQLKLYLTQCPGRYRPKRAGHRARRRALRRTCAVLPRSDCSAVFVTCVPRVLNSTSLVVAPGVTVVFGPEPRKSDFFHNSNFQAAAGDDRAGAAPTKGCFAPTGMLGDPTPDGSAGRRRRDVPRADPARGLGNSADTK